jgi:hypothetical protein
MNEIKLTAHESVGLVVLSTDVRESSGRKIRYIEQDRKDSEAIVFSYTDLPDVEFTVERIHWTSPTDNKFGLFTYAVSKPSGVINGEEYSISTVIDCKPGDGYKEIQRQIVDIVQGYRDNHAG